MLLEDRKFHPT